MIQQGSMKASERMSISELAKLFQFKLLWDDSQKQAAMASYIKPLAIRVFDHMRTMGLGVQKYIDLAKEEGDYKLAQLLEARHGEFALSAMPLFVCLFVCLLPISPFSSLSSLQDQVWLTLLTKTAPSTFMGSAEILALTVVLTLRGTASSLTMSGKSL